MLCFSIYLSSRDSAFHWHSPPSTLCQVDLQCCTINNHVSVVGTYASQYTYHWDIRSIASVLLGSNVYLPGKYIFLVNPLTTIFLSFFHKQLPETPQSAVMYQCKSSSGQTEGKKWSISGLVLKHRTLNTSCLLIRISIRFPSVPSTLVSCSQHSKIDLRLQACDHCRVILLPQLFPLLFLLTACKSAFKKNNKRVILQNKRS